MSDLPSVIELAAAMHRKDFLPLKVGIDYSWIDGSPHRLSLLEYTTAQAGPGEEDVNHRG